MRKKDGTRMTLVEQTMNWCKHYRGMMQPTCSEGVIYKEVQDDTRTGLERFPCFADSGLCTCVKAVFPTREEVEAKEEDYKNGFARMVKIRAAIVERTGGKKPASGEFKCPCCEAGNVRYSVAGLNGHIHALCSTKGCASWVD